MIEKCGSVVVQDVPKQVEPKVVEKKVKIPKVEPKVVEIPKVIPKKVAKKKIAKRKSDIPYDLAVPLILYSQALSLTSPILL